MRREYTTKSVVRIKEEVPSIYKHYTRFEIARIIGARALQISFGAPILLKLSKQQLENVSYNPIKIAELEFSEGVLPITIRRPIPLKVEISKIKTTVIEKVVMPLSKRREERKEARKEVIEETVKEILEPIEGEETEQPTEAPVEGEIEEAE